MLTQLRHRAAFVLMLILLFSLTQTPGTSAQTAQPAQPPPPTGNKPPSPAVGAQVPESYFGPSPSSVQKELVGPVQLLKSGKIDEAAETITLPLYKGQLADGRAVWYVVSDTDDKANADALGLNFSSKLTYAATGKGARNGTIQKDGSVTFDVGTVDFSPDAKLVPGDMPNPFPPKMAQAGSVGDANYSPLVRLANAGGHIYNAPIVAFNVSKDQINFCDGKNVDHKLVHDKVVKICPTDTGGTVTLALTEGLSFGKPILYFSTESSDPVVATLEGATYAPTMADIGMGRDDSFTSAVERIFITINGPMGKDNPQRQGINSAIVDGGSPVNVFGGIPTVATDYSPMWDGNVGVWTQDAIAKGYRSQLREEFNYLDYVQKGYITGPDSKPFGSAGFIINCPVVMRFL